MAADADGGRSRVLTVDVTLSAGHRLMGARQRETSAGVVEHGSLPFHSRVACLARGRKSCRHVIRVRRFREIRLMATNTSDRQPFVDAVGMALRTLHRDMSASQGECGC